MNRAEQFLDVRWQRFRLKRLEMAKWKCEHCGAADKKLNVHHYFYIAGRNVWDYLPESTAVFCDECHEWEHEMLSSRRPMYFGFYGWEHAAAEAIQEELAAMTDGLEERKLNVQ